MVLKPEITVTGALLPAVGAGAGLSLLPALGSVAAFMTPYLTPEAGSAAISDAVNEALAAQSQTSADPLAYYILASN